MIQIKTFNPRPRHYHLSMVFFGCLGMTARDLPSAELRTVFDQQMSLCDSLEWIADSLPYRLDRPHCLQIANLICPLIKRAHASEEALMFPHVAAARVDGGQVVEGLRLEHIEDECFAEEIQFELQKIATDQPVLAPEATGYMLRGFFEGLRRHVRHELELMAALHAGNPLSKPGSTRRDGDVRQL